MGFLILILLCGLVIWLMLRTTRPDDEVNEDNDQFNDHWKDGYNT